ncbi:MAG: hypothetical protein ABL964_00365 [Steroidobacteraceae bacterium]
MENRYSWQRMAVALFDKATTKLGADARQLQDAMFWLRDEQPHAAESEDAEWALATHAEQAKP